MASKLEAAAASQPIANQRRADQKRSARDFQLQQALAKQPQGASTTRTAQALGGAMAEQAGAEAVDTAASTVQEQAQLGGMELEQQAASAADRAAGLKQGLQARNIENEQKVWQKAKQIEDESFKKRMQFQKDELGRLEANDQQLADYAVLSGVSDEQMRNYAQSAQLAYQRDIQVMEHAARVLEQQLQFESAKSEQEKNQQLSKELAEQKRALDEKIARKKAQQQNNSQIFSTVLGVAGAVVGSYAGPAGATAGYAIGSGLGSALGNQMSDSEV